MRIVRPLAVVVAVGAVAWAGFDRLGGEVGAPDSPPPAVQQAGPATEADEAVATLPAAAEDADPGAPDSAPELRFANALDAAAEQAGKLVRLGDAKSRNLPEILAEQRHMNARLDEIDTLVASGSLPPGAAAAVAVYEDGSYAVRGAMDAAQGGFLKLDFGAVRTATERMREGERDLARAAELAD